MKKIEIWFYNLSDHFIIILIIIFTLIILVGLELGFKEYFKESSISNNKTYVITIRDEVCKCDIKYPTKEYIIIGNRICFKSEIEYDLDTSLIRNICFH